jgi:hypothetical protein
MSKLHRSASFLFWQITGLQVNVPVNGPLIRCCSPLAPDYLECIIRKTTATRKRDRCMEDAVGSTANVLFCSSSVCCSVCIIVKCRREIWRTRAQIWKILYRVTNKTCSRNMVLASLKLHQHHSTWKKHSFSSYSIVCSFVACLMTSL